jgi:hypothetical protein
LNIYIYICSILLRLALNSWSSCLGLLMLGLQVCTITPS